MGGIRALCAAICALLAFAVLIEFAGGAGRIGTMSNALAVLQGIAQKALLACRTVGFAFGAVGGQTGLAADAPMVDFRAKARVA